MEIKRANDRKRYRAFLLRIRRGSDDPSDRRITVQEVGDPTIYVLSTMQELLQLLADPGWPAKGENSERPTID